MRKVQLWVREDNERARSLYERHGFAPTGSVVE
jgi:ribosomal protein S18 acetylase RimI-like enzyme